MANLTKQLAVTLTKVGVHSAYGAPVEVDGTTIMPVACTGYGFGAGEATGEQADAGGQGEGGGGGGLAIPVGAYVTREGVTRFEPNVLALLVVGTPFVCVAGRALARVVRALKR
ncbi:hypothetical protein G7067_08465 [Leucobacter insecticola]|uniref:Sporulation protein n=1 Tax=Leucobacter insecticola TaxID=2714934 RepID=A0A6G8FJ03_9MICO|nr:spore germination protein GerW family protein [Leucobacter insecticola]QIM16446.1 hypothetical protein G7067_08465 [Leucobacter insecticola]